MEKTEADKMLDDSFGKHNQFPKINEKIGRPSKIELGGEQVMKHLMKLAETTDLSYSSMAKKINEEYELNISKSNVLAFFKTNVAAIMSLAEENKSLSKVRASLYLEHNQVLVKDIKTLEKQISDLIEDKYLESDKKSKALGDLIDKKGRLLLRHARLSGKLDSNKIGNIEKMQVNIFQQADKEKSELIKRLKKAEFTDEKKKVIDVTP